MLVFEFGPNLLHSLSLFSSAAHPISPAQPTAGSAPGPTRLAPVNGPAPRLGPCYPPGLPPPARVMPTRQAERPRLTLTPPPRITATPTTGAPPVKSDDAPSLLAPS